jgi:hypothetical protein
MPSCRRLCPCNPMPFSQAALPLHPAGGRAALQTTRMDARFVPHSPLLRPCALMRGKCGWRAAARCSFAGGSAPAPRWRACRPPDHPHVHPFCATQPVVMSVRAHARVKWVTCRCSQAELVEACFLATCTQPLRAHAWMLWMICRCPQIEPTSDLCLLITSD